MESLGGGIRCVDALRPRACRAGAHLEGPRDSVTRSASASTITPRSTRLLRVCGFRSLQRAVASSLRSTVVEDRGWEDTIVLVPSVGAADQLRRTLQSLWARDASHANDLPGIVAEPPAIVTRGGVYAHLPGRVAQAPALLDELAREVLFRRAADAALEQGREQGSAPPYEVRPGLIPEMLALYDALRRQHRTIDDFERLVGGALETGADIDRGARRLL